MKKHYLFFLSLISIFTACTDKPEVSLPLDEPQLPATVYNYKELSLPLNSFIPNDFSFSNDGIFGFPEFIDNNVHVDDDKATLGRVLFYDTKLSLNNTISCGSCHLQSLAFADGSQFAKGFEGRETNRNSMAIINPILQRNLFWDSRSFSIQDLSLRPVQHHVEMGMENLDLLVGKLSTVDYYPALFQKAFSSKEITSEKISEAITNFVASITTANSRFDQGLNDGFKDYSQIELLGKQVFFSDRAKCSTCHAGNNFSAQDGPNDPYGGGGNSGGNNLKGTTNIGLDFVSTDVGRENGSFRIPSLRNIAKTAPYMHDGRFSTLEEVIDHYRFGIKPAQNLDVKFTDGHGNVKPLDISETEKFALVAFLKTLTDESLLKDPKYSDPFKN